eukprot:JZ550576.1.p1 GENE.JZ550576.1~~JZ550576.1.p1  ORF type:complete len:102 (-),score=1.48 JZ550576.1:62-367(-)
MPLHHAHARMHIQTERMHALKHAHLGAVHGGGKHEYEGPCLCTPPPINQSTAQSINRSINQPLTVHSILAHTQILFINCLPLQSPPQGPTHAAPGTSHTHS